MQISKMREYRDALPKRDYFPKTDARNQHLFYSNPYFDRELLQSSKANELRTALSNFQQLANESNPFLFYSKLGFVEQTLCQEACSRELLLRYITDRVFYFAEYRDHANLLGDNFEIHPFPSLKSLALYESSWQLAAKTDKELLEQSSERINELLDSTKYNSEKVASLIAESLKEDSTLSVYELLAAEYSPEAVEEILYPFRAKLLNRDHARMACQNDWLPTTAHSYFWQETNGNYRDLCSAITRREADLTTSNRIIRDLNTLSKRSKAFHRYPAADDEKRKIETTLEKTVLIFEKYVRSLLYTVRKPEYSSILTQPNKKLKERTYTSAIHRLLLACYSEGQWNRLTPLFLYHAFADNTKVILQNSKPRLVRNIRVINKPARIKSMTSMTGRRAAINLVLYGKLLTLFGDTGKNGCLFDRTLDLCMNPQSKHKFKNAMDMNGCYELASHVYPCPFIQSTNDLNDFGFALTTGYANLFHHSCGEDEILLTYDEIYSTKEPDEIDEQSNPRTSDADEERRYPIFRYHLNFSKPVGDLEGLLMHHIENCIPNQPRYLSPLTPNSYKRESADPFFSPYEELSAILLQDMHLPAMMRISRKIKKVISANPDYLTTYREFLSEPTETGEFTGFLQNIIRKHGLKRQAMQYSYYQTSGQAYNIDDALQGILEYELRSQIYNQASHSIAEIVAKVLDPKLFLYPPEVGLLRMVKEPIR